MWPPALWPLVCQVVTTDHNLVQMYQKESCHKSVQTPPYYTMSLPLSVYLESFQSRRGIFITWLVKVLIIFLCMLGMFSIYRRGMNILSPHIELETAEATEDRRDRLYENRRNLSLSVCQQYQEEITLHTVKMFDLVPPAPIGMNADILVDRVKQFYWCKVISRSQKNTNPTLQ